MRRTMSVLAFAAVLATGATSFALLPVEEAPAAPREATFHVPASDGYGVGECLAAGDECGRVIADAWCETQGYLRATSYGVAAPEDVTGSVVLVSTVSRAERPVAITCTR